MKLTGKETNNSEEKQDNNKDGKPQKPTDQGCKEET